MSKITEITDFSYPNSYPRDFSGYDFLQFAAGSMVKIRTYIYPAKDKRRANNRCCLYLRITVDRKIVQTNLGVLVDAERWDSKKQLLTGKDKETLLINQIVTGHKAALMELTNRIFWQRKQVTAKEYLALYLGHDSNGGDFIEWMSQQAHKQLENHEVTFNTWRMRDLVVRKLRGWRDKWAFSDVTADEIRDFMKYDRAALRAGKKGNVLTMDGDNGVAKDLKILRTFVYLALKQTPALISRDPFLEIKIKFRHQEKLPLTLAQVKRLWELYNSTGDVGINREILCAFLFQIHTGLRISDVKTLHAVDISTVSFGDKMVPVIKKKPQKTARYDKTLVIPIPDVFIDRITARTGKIFDLPADHRYNAELKRIGNLLGITENISSHIARHTFATIQMFMANTNPVVTMNLLGHSRLDTTSIYAHQVVGQNVEAIQRMEQLVFNNGPDAEPHP